MDFLYSTIAHQAGSTGEACEGGGGGGEAPVLTALIKKKTVHIKYAAALANKLQCKN